MTKKKEQTKLEKVIQDREVLIEEGKKLVSAINQAQEQLKEINNQIVFLNGQESILKEDNK